MRAKGVFSKKKARKRRFINGFELSKWGIDKKTRQKLLKEKRIKIYQHGVNILDKEEIELREK